MKAQREKTQRLIGILAVVGPFVLIAVAYLFAATREISLPGIYMDAVNPDYLVTRWLNPSPEYMPSWIVPGNDISGRFPLLVALHHGSMQLWIGAPFFWIFGMSVIGLRLTHAMFGLMVLAAWYALQRQTGLSRTWAVAFGIALAVDPSFIYAFRNQCYITMSPAALLMLGVMALFFARATAGRARTTWLAACGLLTGLASWGYFIYAFFFPAMMIAAWLLPTNPIDKLSRNARVLVLGTGIALGVSPFVLGFSLMAQDLGSIENAIEYYLTVQPSLGIADASVAWSARIVHLEEMLSAVIGNTWHHALMFGSWTATPGAAWKYFLLIGLPAILWLLAEWRRCATPLLRTILGLQLSFAFGAMLFGTRINAHHYMPLVPLSYAGLAAGIGAFTRLQGHWGKFVNYTSAGVIVTLLALNVAGNIREIEELRRTGGVGNFSDAISQFGIDLFEGDHNRVLVLPDWGLYMPTAFLTQASMEIMDHEDLEKAKTRLCEGKDVVLALIEGDRTARFEQWQAQLDWTAPQIRSYRQRDTQVLFEVATFSGADAGKLCPGNP